MVLRALCVVLILGSINLSFANELKKTKIKINQTSMANTATSKKLNVAKEKTVGSEIKDTGTKTIELTVELALTESQQQNGLMFRKFLAPGEGMLFVFSGEQPRQFWMKNTLIPLSIAFIDSNKTIFQVSDMKPMKTLIQKEIDRAESIKPAKYVLEVPKGWFSQNKIGVGSTLIWPNESSFIKK